MLALAPDPSSQSAGRSLSTPTPWSGTGAFEALMLTENVSVASRNTSLSVLTVKVLVSPAVPVKFNVCKALS